FNKYTLVAKKFDDPDVDDDEKRGAHFDLVWGRGDSTNLHGFVSRTGAAEHAFGTSLSYNPSDAFRLSLASVRQVTTPDADPNGTTAAQSDTVHSAELKGRLAALDYSAVYATYTDGGDSAEAI